MNIKSAAKNNIFNLEKNKLFNSTSILTKPIANKDKNALQILLGNASDVTISIDSRKLAALSNEKGAGHMALEAFANQDKEVAAKHTERDALKNQLLNDNGMFSNNDKKIINDKINDIDKWLDTNSSADHLINTMDNFNQYLKNNNIDLASFDKISKKDSLNEIISLTQDIQTAYADYSSDVDKYNAQQQQLKKANSYKTIKQLSTESTPNDIIDYWANEKTPDVYNVVDLEKNTLEIDSNYLKESLANFNNKLGRSDKNINDPEQKKFYDELYKKTAALDDAEKNYKADYIKKAKAQNDSAKENIDKIYNNIEQANESPFKVSNIDNISQQDRINAANILLTTAGQNTILNITPNTTYKNTPQKNIDNNELITPTASINKENIITNVKLQKKYNNILEKDRINNAVTHIFNEKAADKTAEKNIANIINEIF